MLGWIFGTLLLVVLIVYVLDYLEVVDFIEAIGAIFKLAFAVLAMVSALLIWSARRLVAVARTPGPSDVPRGVNPDDPPSVRRGKIETRTMVRSRGQK